MKCLLCCDDKVHKHGKTEKGHQRYKSLQCTKTFPEHFDTLYYGRHLSQTEVHTILQSHVAGSSLRGVSRISGRAYGTVVSLVRAANQKAQMIHSAEVQEIETEQVSGDEMWSFGQKNRKTASQKN